MNQALLSQRIKTLSNTSVVSLEVVKKLQEYIQHSDDWGLRRINPFHLAKELSVTPDNTIDLLVQASRAGLFDLSWSLLCPICGGILNQNHSINGLQSENDLIHCTLCDIDVPIIMDDYVEVTFTINPDISQFALNFHQDIFTYSRYVFSESVLRAPELGEYIRKVFRGFYVVDPKDKLEVNLPDFSDSHLSMESAEHHKVLRFQVVEQKSPSPQVINVTITENGFTADKTEVMLGSIVFQVTNLMDKTFGFTLFAKDYGELAKIIQKYPSQIKPFLTGKVLLNNQVFRELYKIQSLVAGLQLHIRSLTILFTDLKGSTELYDNIGDVAAYNLIQKHFSILSQSVKKHSGAIIKTMGDAIMATFSEPLDGILASMDMMQELKSITNENGHELGLKIGLHEGPSLAINNDGFLDYFGQTVNIAARVQGLAKAGEIWITNSVLDSRPVFENLSNSQYKIEKHSVSLKGVGQPTTVFQCFQD